MSGTNNLLQRRNISRASYDVDEENIWNGNYTDDKDLEEDYKEPKLDLMEEVLLLGLKEREGYTSFWNESISRALRGCIMVELALRGRIELEKTGIKKKSLWERKVCVTNDSTMGVALLDEALKHIKESERLETVKNWIDYLCGESWNPLKMCHNMKRVKERVAKSLVEKGVLTTDRTSFLLFDLTTHPLKDKEIKTDLLKKIQDSLLTNWTNDPHRMDPRTLSLIVLARSAGVIDRALYSLDDEDFALASKRLSEIDDINTELEVSRCRFPEIIWAVFSAFSDITLT